MYGIVKQQQGFVSVYSEPGQGTTFRIYLPSVTGKEDERVESPSAPRETGTETILVVEDEESVRRLAARILTGAGYRVHAAAGMSEALSIADEGAKIDLLLSDVVMPEAGGIQVYAVLSARIPGLKALFMSGYTDDVVVNHGILAEGIQFISKPFTSQKLLRKVREALGG